MEDIKTKICKICKQCKESTFFHRNGKTLYPSCKECRSIERKKIKYDAPKEGIRECPCCKNSLDISNFHCDKSQPTGLQSYCKKCQTEKTKKYTSTLNGFIKKIYKDMYHNAEKRAKKLLIDITCDDIHEMYNKQNGKCALSGLQLSHETYAYRDNEHIINRMNISIDRINSNLGYTKDNVQLVGAIVNRMKTDLPDQEFINFCSIVAEFNKNKTT